MSPHRDAGSLTGVSTQDLEHLLTLVRGGRIACPVASTSLEFAGLGALAKGNVVDVLQGLDELGTAAVLAAVISERSQKGARVELVWSGPEAARSATRETSVVVAELFAGARRSVLVGGYSFDNGARIFRPLCDVMAEHGVSARLFVELPGERHDAARAEAVGREASRRTAAFLSANWPFGAPHPEIYYDPRSMAGSEYASLHAKCVVVDGRLALIGSANFTDRGHTRNIEVGVLVEDEALATRLTAQWQGLVDSGLVAKAELP